MQHPIAESTPRLETTRLASPVAWAIAPAGKLVVAAVVCVVGIVAALWLALGEPSLGIRWAPAPEGAGWRVAGYAIDPPPGAPPVDARVTRLSAPGFAPIDTLADDLIEEPDFFDDYPTMDRFFSRQRQLSAMLEAPTVSVQWHHGEATGESLLTPQPRRLSQLPALFWWQLGVGTLCCLIGIWVSALRPSDPGARALAVTGAVFPLAAYAAAIYSSRELALAGDVMRWLSAVNHVGTIGFGGALVALFLLHPRRLVGRGALATLAVVVVAWIGLDIAHAMPDQNWGVRIPAMAEMFGAIGAGLAQWRGSTGEPAQRAALRWLLLAALAGCGLFVFTLVGAKMLGLFPPLSQGAAFGYFLIMYVGLALGVGRYRLFDLDRWAYRVLLWVFGALTLVLVDLCLVLLFKSDPTLTLGAALLIAGWLYFPLRQSLWRWAVAGTRRRPEQELPRILDIALAPTPAARDAQWDRLLRESFRPVQLRVPGPHDDPTQEADGLAVTVAACGGLAPRRLVYADGGRRLFSPDDRRYIDTLCRLLDQAAAGRDAYERGGNAERERIAREMHDTLGARLLTALHTRDDGRRDDLLRETVQDLRTIVYGLSGANARAADVLADLRHETAERAESAGAQLGWVADGLTDDVRWSARFIDHMRSIQREAVSNALRHGRPSMLDVHFAWDGDRLTMTVADDGQGFDSDHVAGGMGMRSLRDRCSELGGHATWRARAGGGTVFVASVWLPGATP